MNNTPLKTINLLRQLLNSNLGASIIIGECNQPVLYSRHDVTRYRLLQSLFIVTLLQHCMEVRHQTDNFRDGRRQTSRSYMSDLAASAVTVDPCSWKRGLFLFNYEFMYPTFLILRQNKEILCLIKASYTLISFFSTLVAVFSILIIWKQIVNLLPLYIPVLIQLWN